MNRYAFTLALVIAWLVLVALIFLAAWLVTELTCLFSLIV